LSFATEFIAQPPASARFREAEIALQLADEVKERLLVHRLHGARHVAMTVFERLVGPSPRPQSPKPSIETTTSSALRQNSRGYPD
jgi:hypothetical protein